jgi:hypothetical protein
LEIKIPFSWRSNKKRLRIYDMEVEEEEDEETYISSGLTATGDALSNF